MSALIGAAALSGVANIGSNIFNAYMQNKMNRESQDFSKSMYHQGFRDNVKLWNMNNEYNSPEMQRSRLENAGLNPALMYGGSGGGGAVSQTPQGGKALPARFEAPQAKLDFMDRMLNIKMKKAQIEHMKEQTGILGTEGKQKKIQLVIDEYTQYIKKEGLAMQYGGMVYDNEIKKYERDSAKAKYEGIVNLNVSKIKNEDLRNKILQSELLLRETGMSWHDNAIARVVVTLIDNPDKLREFIDNIIAAAKNVGKGYYNQHE